MPKKPLKPCRAPGCPNLSEQSYCDMHRKGTDPAAANRMYDETKRDQDMRLFYSSTAWRRLRNLKLKFSPLCEECFRKGRMVKAVIADHILPARMYTSKRLDMNNLQSLCRSCHNKKTAKE